MVEIDPATPTPHQPMPAVAFVYPGVVEHWADGDTVDVRIDQGFTSARTERLRLLGVDTPERGRDGWAQATAAAEALAPVGTAVIVRSYRPRPESIGRYLADVWRAGDGAHLGEQLVASHHARRVRMSR